MTDNTPPSNGGKDVTLPVSESLSREVFIALCIRAAQLGLNNTQMAYVLGYPGETSYRKVLEGDPVLYQAVAEASKDPVREVEFALYKMAVGFPTKEIHVKREKDKDTGEIREVVTKEVLKRNQPNVISQIFYLKNKNPEEWRDRIEHFHTVRDRFDVAHKAREALPPPRRKRRRLLT